jgi:hypothetical protein
MVIFHFSISRHQNHHLINFCGSQAHPAMTHLFGVVGEKVVDLFRLRWCIFLQTPHFKSPSTPLNQPNFHDPFDPIDPNRPNKA